MLIQTKLNHLIGCSGFSNKDWKGFFYPDTLTAKDYLSYYAEHFNAVEINSTFYRKPTLKTLESWYAQTPDDFLFFIKIPQTITHINQLKNSKLEIAEFCNHMKYGLKAKLAGFLFQFSPSFVYNKENIRRIEVGLDQRFVNVVEFRHKSWWDAEVYEALADKNIIFSGVSIPKDISDEMILNNPTHLYYRLHGKPVLFKSEYTEEELQTLSNCLLKSGRTAFIFFNNTWGTAAIKNALFMKGLMG